jgi:hypothetical protein
VVENYKTILKSVSIIKEMKEDAKNRNVILDEDVLARIQKEIDRLVSERDLRFEIDNLEIGSCTPQQVSHLQELLDDAKAKGVANGYLDEAEVIKEKMSRSIQTQDIF